jgi:hypothetical protein
MPAARIFLQLIADFVVYLGLLIRPREAIAAENLFLRRQLALYQERKVEPQRMAGRDSSASRKLVSSDEGRQLLAASGVGRTKSLCEIEDAEPRAERISDYRTFPNGDVERGDLYFASLGYITTYGRNDVID